MLATKNPACGLSIFAMAAGFCTRAKTWAISRRFWLRGVPALAGAFLLAGCMASGPRALLDGDRALQDGKYARAVQSLTRATELLPQEPRAWNLLGLAYHRSGQAQLAAQAYRKAMEF